MKKKIAAVLCLAAALLLAGCGTLFVKINYGSSSIYSKEDMDAAVGLIKKEFSGWKGCRLHSISYSSDEKCSEENLAWLNDLADRQTPDTAFTQCAMFKSDFHSPKLNAGAWNPDFEYTDWQWWLARTDGGEWYLISWGY